jgi:hypothetical protein
MDQCQPSSSPQARKTKPGCVVPSDLMEVQISHSQVWGSMGVLPWQHTISSLLGSPNFSHCWWKVEVTETQRLSTRSHSLLCSLVMIIADP